MPIPACAKATTAAGSPSISFRSSCRASATMRSRPTAAARRPRCAISCSKPVASHIASSHPSRNRIRIAQAAARLIAEHGLTDWAAAKRKACRELGLPERATLPPNDEVEQALHEYNTLFRHRSQPLSLRAQREAAMKWMDELSRWHPVLIGGGGGGRGTGHRGG